jgi:hypothetical protein
MDQLDIFVRLLRGPTMGFTGLAEKVTELIQHLLDAEGV